MALFWTQLPSEPGRLWGGWHGPFFWNIVLFPFPLPVIGDLQATAQRGVAQAFLGEGLCFSGSAEGPGEGWGQGGRPPLGKPVCSGILAARLAGGFQAAPFSGALVL